MGFFDSLSSLFISDAYAEEPQQVEEPQEAGEEGGDVKAEAGEGEGEEKSEDGGEEGATEGGDEESGDGGEDAGADEEEEEEEEEDEEEPEDPAPKIQEECAKTASCAPLKHEYEECAERVMKAQEDEDHKGPHEDCVEEFFEYTHCVSQCAAPKLFKLLK